MRLTRCIGLGLWGVVTVACGGRVEFGAGCGDDGCGDNAFEYEQADSSSTSSSGVSQRDQDMAGELDSESSPEMSETRSTAGSGADGDQGVSAQNMADRLPRCEGSCSGCDPELGFCYIQCVGDYTCMQSELTCPEGWPCYVLCEGQLTCTQADVTCPPGQQCALECSGRSSCTQLEMACEGYQCELSCNGTSACTQLRRSEP
jgi:hypothetical protein